MYRFLLTRRWVGGLALAVAVAVACVLLGSWQLGRYEERTARNDLVRANYDREPGALDDVLPVGASGLAVRDTWTPVRLTGSYDADGTVLLRNRPLDGKPGYHVLVPFLTRQGRVVLVDRGWVPTGDDASAPDAVPVPPRGSLDVVVRLLPPEEPSDRTAPDGQAFRIDPGALAPAMAAAAGVPSGAVVTDAYGELATERASAATATPPPAAPVVLPRPVLAEGPHLGYALQWVVFALIALGGFVLVARRTAHEDDVPAHAVPGDGGPSARRPPRPTDEQVEDAAVDAECH